MYHFSHLGSFYRELNHYDGIREPEDFTFASYIDGLIWWETNGWGSDMMHYLEQSMDIPDIWVWRSCLVRWCKSVIASGGTITRDCEPRLFSAIHIFHGNYPELHTRLSFEINSQEIYRHGL